MKRKWPERSLLLLVLLVAAFLRLYQIDSVPPGMTHDEADHGMDAWGVVQGDRPLYFTVGYGREPLYDYSTAPLMLIFGPSVWAGRLTAVFWSMILLAATYAWVKRAFGTRVALLTAAALAVSFWPLMTARHALRSVTLPALLALTAALWWRGLPSESPRQRALSPKLFLVAGSLLGLTLYTYMAARVTWVLFPALTVFLLLFKRGWGRGRWKWMAAGLLLAAIVAAPLFIYLQTHSAAEERLDHLSGPLEAALEGDFTRLARNVGQGLGMFFLEGDSLWRYNIPGQPLLGPIMGVLFLAGLLYAIWHWRRPAYAFALMWLALGLAPVLATGVEASVTRAVGIQPLLYLFPALAAAALFQKSRLSKAVIGLYAVLLVFTAAFTFRDYFHVWAGNPQVRVQYETTLAGEMHWLNNSGEAGPVAISSIAPNRFHDPSTARMILRNEDVQLRWFDGRGALIFPNDPAARMLFYQLAPLDAALQPLMLEADLLERVALDPDDINAYFEVFRWDARAAFAGLPLAADPVNFGEHVCLRGYALNTPAVHPGEQVELISFWEAIEPRENLVLFVHLLGSDGLPMAQADGLEAPSYYWRPGDNFAQLHRLVIPADTPAGHYSLIIGLYLREDNYPRLPVVRDGQTVGDHVVLGQVEVKSPADE